MSLAGQSNVERADKPRKSIWRRAIDSLDHHIAAGTWKKRDSQGKTGALDNQIEIVTPENIAFRYIVAGPFPRLIAFVIDVLIWSLAFGILSIFFNLLLGLMAALGLPDLARTADVIVSAALGVGYFLTGWFYSAAFESWMNGQTLAKRLLRLRVLTENGSPINGMQATLRGLFRAGESLPFVSIQIFDPWINSLIEEVTGWEGATPYFPIFPTMLVGLFAMAITTRFQRIGDVVCGTVVVHEPRDWKHGLAQFDDGRIPHLAEYIPAGFVVSDGLSRALAAYVDRRRYFSAGRRNEIAAHIAKPMLEKFGLPADTSYDLLLCALYYRAFIADQGLEDALDLRLNPATRSFEGHIPEHKLQEVIRSAKTIHHESSEEELRRVRGMGGRTGGPQAEREASPQVSLESLPTAVPIDEDPFDASRSDYRPGESRSGDSRSGDSTAEKLTGEGAAGDSSPPPDASSSRPTSES